MPPGTGSAGFGQNFHFQARELADEVLGRGNGARRHQKLGRCAVMRADALERPEHLGHVGPQNTPIGVDFVNHHEAQAVEKPAAAVVIGQELKMQHVRVADKDVGRSGFQGPALGRRGGRI